MSALPNYEITADQTERLRRLVADHNVCWETRPEYAVVNHELRPVGYVVEIAAAHHEPHHPPVAGCPECVAPLRALEEIVDYVTPKEPRPSRYDVRVRWGALQFAPRRANRPEVVSTLSILHGSGVNEPIDACEDRCLDDIVGALKRIGAREGSWSPG